MRLTASILLSTLLLLGGCRTAEPWICGTALFENALAEERAQISPYVFCAKDEAELVLTVALSFPDEDRRHPVSFYFRAKRADERLVLRERREQVSKSGALWSRSTDFVGVVIQGEDLWVALITQGGMHSLGSAAVFAADFSVSEPGYVLGGRWEKKPDQRRAGHRSDYPMRAFVLFPACLSLQAFAAARERPTDVAALFQSVENLAIVRTCEKVEAAVLTRKQSSCR